MTGSGASDYTAGAMTTTAYIGIGSNLGDREGTLDGAVRMVGDLDGVEVVSRSSIIETAPVGVIEQPDFLNMVVEVETTLGARELLDRLLDIEQRFGRERRERWGPRTLDLDLLFFEDMVINEPGLTVPHPEMPNRGFVLEPLAEIAPGFVHPVSHLSVSQLWLSWRHRHAT